jgi:hypothetical protein
MSRLTKPSVFGPGGWLTMHFLALMCVTEYMREIFRVVVMIYVTHLPCRECQEHALEFLENNPITEDTDLFEWTVRFHNHANVKTGKREVSVKDAKKLVFSNLESVSLVSKFGPGIWIFISIVCLHARTFYERMCVFSIVTYLCREIGKQENYKLAALIDDEDVLNSFKKAVEEGEIFAWSVDFHNIINLRLGKMKFSMTEAQSTYVAVCTSNCH